MNFIWRATKKKRFENHPGNHLARNLNDFYFVVYSHRVVCEQKKRSFVFKNVFRKKIKVFNMGYL